MKSDEIIIIDDGSTDGTSDYLKKWAVNRPNVLVLSSPGLGLVDALNLGISKSTKEWIARFDVDDDYLEERLDVQMAEISDTTVAVFSDYANSSNTGTSLGVIRSSILPGFTEFSIISSQRLAHSSALIKRQALINCGGYLKDDFPAEDLGLWLRLALVGSFASSPKPLLNYLVSEGSITSLRSSEMIAKKMTLIQKNRGALQKIASQISPNPIRIFFSYRHFEGARERRLLCYRDFLLGGKIGVVSKIKTLIACSGLVVELLHPKSWWILLRLRRESKMRKEIRAGGLPRHFQ